MYFDQLNTALVSLHDFKNANPKGLNNVLYI